MAAVAATISTAAAAAGRAGAREGTGAAPYWLSAPCHQCVINEQYSKNTDLHACGPVVLVGRRHICQGECHVLHPVEPHQHRPWLRIQPLAPKLIFQANGRPVKHHPKYHPSPGPVCASAVLPRSFRGASVKSVWVFLGVPRNQLRPFSCRRSWLWRKRKRSRAGGIRCRNRKPSSRSHCSTAENSE